MRSYGKEKKLRFAYVFMAFCFFFSIIGFSFFNIFSQRIISEIPTRRSVNEEIESLDHRETEDGSVSNIPYQVLSWVPRTFYLLNFATKQQCKAIIDMAKPKLEPSLLALRKGETEETTQNVRTSTGMFIGADEDESGILAAIEEKIAIATRIPRDYYELATFILYLSSVEEGGETIFPFENGRNMNGRYDYQKCIGLKVKPQQGDAILFYNLFPNRTIDQRSLHGSCPVIKGEKWVATKWIRDQTYDEYDDDS